MEYAKLGNTDIEVSKLCVGCMSFGKAGTLHDWTVDEAETERSSNMRWISASIFLTRPMVIQKEPARNIWGGRSRKISQEIKW